MPIIVKMQTIHVSLQKLKYVFLSECKPLYMYHDFHSNSDLDPLAIVV